MNTKLFKDNYGDTLGLGIDAPDKAAYFVVEAVEKDSDGYDTEETRLVFSYEQAVAIRDWLNDNIE